MYGTSPGDVAGAAIGAGTLAWVSVSLLLAAFEAGHERAALLAGMAGEPPADGTRAIIVGPIEPLGPCLLAPLSGRECVAYTFEIYERRSSPGFKSGATKVVYCDGIAIAPSAVATAAGTFALLAVPELDCNDTEPDRVTAATRAAELLRTIPYVPPPPPFTRPAIERQWNDDAGAFRRERRHVEGAVDLEVCRMSERIIERGACVSVFGQYSASRRAIVPDQNDWSKITRIMKGDPDAIARQLGASVRRRLIGAFLFAAAAAGVATIYVAYLRVPAV